MEGGERESAQSSGLVLSATAACHRPYPPGSHARPGVTEKGKERGSEEEANCLNFKSGGQAGVRERGVEQVEILRGKKERRRGEKKRRKRRRKRRRTKRGKREKNGKESEKEKESVER